MPIASIWPAIRPTAKTEKIATVRSTATEDMGPLLLELISMDRSVSTRPFMEAKARGLRGIVVVGGGADRLPAPMSHRRLSDRRLPVADFEPKPFARKHQHGHRQQLNAKFIWTARFDRLFTIVAQKRTHIGGQFRVFGAMRRAQPALRHPDRRRLVRTNGQQ